MLMAWLGKPKKPEDSSGPKNVRTEGLWIKCDSCRGTIWKKDLEANLMVCTECGFPLQGGRGSSLGDAGGRQKVGVL